MKKQDYYRRPTPQLGKTRSPRRKRDFSSLKSILIILVCLAFVAGAYFAIPKVYHQVISLPVWNWTPKEVSVSGVDGAMSKEIAALAQGKVGKPFTTAQAVALREEVSKKYTMLRKISVKRGLISGDLKISVQLRTPLAKFMLAGGELRFIDSDSTIYANANPDPLQVVPFVEVEGDAPDKLSDEFVDLLQGALALRKELDFAFLRFNLRENTVKMYMPDGCIIDFGPASKLKEKARRAAQITTYSKDKFEHPRLLDFSFFEEGKVFSRQIAH